MSEQVEAVAKEEAAEENTVVAAEAAAVEQPSAAHASAGGVAEQDGPPAAQQADAQATVDAADAGPQADQQVVEEVAPPASTEPAPADHQTAAMSEAVNESTSDSAHTTDAESQDDAKSDKKVVRTLAVGEQITGTVKRIADFGAFVDIGVGRDGLIHISELSVRRVGKVTDVLQEGQEVTAWIKKLDRERNRISLTLIDPETKTIRDLEKGDVVKGRVTRLLPYGAFVDIGIGRDALLHVREMAEGFVAKPEDVVKVDEEIEVRIIELSRRRSRVDLSLKGLRPEPEAAVPHQTQAPQAEVEEEEEVPEDPFEEVEVLSPMELAFKRAMEAEGMDVRPKKRGKRNRRLSGRDIQDEIISRTLNDNRR